MSLVSDSSLGIEVSRHYNDKEMREERREKREERGEKREERREKREERNEKREARREYMFANSMILGSPENSDFCKFCDFGGSCQL